MNNQCQSCGSYNNGIVPTASCEGCHAIICLRCLVHHKQGCEQVQTKKRLGQGPTVRVILEPPVEVPAAEPVTLPSLDPSPEVAQAVQEIMTKDFSLPAQWTPRPEPTAFPPAVLESLRDKLASITPSEKDVLVDIAPETAADILSASATIDDDVLGLEQMKADGTVVDATIPAVAEEPEAQF